MASPRPPLCPVRASSDLPRIWAGLQAPPLRFDRAVEFDLGLLFDEPQKPPAEP
jgi:hypothetical protein